ncbi:MAG: adenine phosphoribosyltransferase [Reyranellaceae bacterium]
MPASIPLRDRLHAILDAPRVGMLSNDIVVPLEDGAALRDTIDWLAAAARAHRPDMIAGIEARGFLFATAVAYALGLGFVALRKEGRLPGEVVTRPYATEYASGALELRANAVRHGQRVVVVEDLLASGGTLEAAVAMLRQIGAEVPAAICVVELKFLDGRRRLDIPVESLLSYDT